MFGGLTGLTSPSGTDFGERMLNAVASQSIRHLFTSSESVDVEVRCYPSSKLLQGSIDSFKMNGKGLVIRREFRTAELTFETDAVAIDIGAALGGQMRLKQPTQAVAQVTLTEDDINQSFRAELVRKRLQEVQIPALESLTSGQAVSFTNVQIELLPDNRVTLFADTQIPGHDSIPVSLTARLAIERRRRILFQEAQFRPEPVPEAVRSESETLSRAFAEVLNDMVDLERFDLDGVTLRLNRLETEGKNLLFSGYAQIDRFPGT